MTLTNSEHTSPSETQLTLQEQILNLPRPDKVTAKYMIEAELEDLVALFQQALTSVKTTEWAGDTPTAPKTMDYHKMVTEIDEIVSGDWGYSVTDDMVNLPSGKYRKFTQKQAQEMSNAIGRIYMIAHGVHCTACGSKYLSAGSGQPAHPSKDKCRVRMEDKLNNGGNQHG